MIYNEIDPFAAQWLANLIESGELPQGHVLTKSITELTAKDLEGATQVHLFAGIGGWPLSLKLAGWPEDQPVWTGSCPCQPFSVAGKKKGNNDERHLWPEMFRLIKECKPPVIFGEQVASPDGIDWMQAVQADLEAAGYEVGKLDLCAAGIGAPHIRQRIFWVAVSNGFRREQDGLHIGGTKKTNRGWATDRGGNASSTGRMGNTNRNRGGRESRGCSREEGMSRDRKVGDSTGASGQAGFWSEFEWLLCRDNKIRPTQPGLFPLAHGLPRSLGEGSSREQRMGLLAAKRSRIGQLKGYGNAIVPQVAAAFITAFMEYLTEANLTEANLTAAHLTGVTLHTASANGQRSWMTK